MYRKSSVCTLSSSSSSFSARSSYSSGTASIIVNQPSKIIETPPRTTSLNFKQLISQSPSSPSSLLSLFEDEFEDIDLIADDESSTSSNSSSKVSTEGPPLDNMSNLILSALKLSQAEGKNLSSLSNGNASIICDKKPSNSKSNKKKSIGLSYKLFGWGDNSKTSSKMNKQTPSIPKQSSAKKQVFPSRYDDGKADLLFQGIRVKEIQSTLDPIILSPSKYSIYSNDDLFAQGPDYFHISY